MKKGFVLTLDAMLALVLAAVFFTVIMHFVTAPKIKADEYLFAAGQDMLTVADKDGSLLEAAAGNGTRLNGFVGSLPANLCVKLTVVNSTDGELYSRTNGCQQPEKYVISRRTMANNSEFYTAAARVWYR